MPLTWTPLDRAVHGVPSTEAPGEPEYAAPGPPPTPLVETWQGAPWGRVMASQHFLWDPHLILT